MKRIYVLFSSLLILMTISVSAQKADTVKAEKAISFGIDLLGPVNYALGKENYSFEGFISYRLNYKYYLLAETGYSSFSYSQYNYSYNSQGLTLRLGTDISMMQPVKSKINHFAGIGLRYGISVYNQEIPALSLDNYWGQINTSVQENLAHAHYLEALGGVRAEIFRNVSIGWSLRFRMLLYSSGKDQPKPVYIPGMGGTEKFLNSAISYHIIYKIPLKPSSSE